MAIWGSFLNEAVLEGGCAPSSDGRFLWLVMSWMRSLVFWCQANMTFSNDNQVTEGTDRAYAAAVLYLESRWEEKTLYLLLQV